MNNVIRRTILLVTFILVGSLAMTVAATGTATKPPLRIYIFTKVATPGALLPPDQQPRQDSVTDLKKRLVSHTELLVEAPSADQADLTLEVLRRDLKNGENVRTPTFDPHPDGSSATGTNVVAVLLKATRNESATHIVGAGPTWLYAADDVLTGVERWGKKNYDTLVRKEEKK